MAERDAVGHAAGGVRWLRRGLEPVALHRLIAERWLEAAAWASSFVAAWFFADFALRRHAKYHSTAYDFGFFDQIIWNTSEGRWFETSFVEYNFLGQHVEPVLLVFAGMYRLGAGPETLLIVQAAFAALAAVPLFYATRRLTGMPAVAMCLSMVYLVSPALHRALDFDLHPELLAPFFVFAGLYFVAAERPSAAIAAVAPVLLLKEDMAVVALMFGVLVWARGWRAHGVVLASTALVWGLVAVFVLMPLVRGGGSDLNERFAYLFADTSVATVVPVAMWRGASHLVAETLPASVDMLVSAGGVALLSPAILLAVPSAMLNGLSDHQKQTNLDLQYGVAPFTLMIMATALALGGMARGGDLVSRLAGRNRTGLAARAAAVVILLSAGATFVTSSPYSPRTERYAPDAAHREIVMAALGQIPRDASVSAQNTLLPHLSQRQHIYEFPDVPPRVEWVIVDASLPVTKQSGDAGYDSVLGRLQSWGFDEVFNAGGVRVFSREVEP